MKKAILILLALCWAASLVMLISALTDLFPGNPFVEHKLVVGIFFISITQLVKRVYKQLMKTKDI